jgi:hypothetical protein
MTTLTKILISIILGLLLFSCQFDINSGVRGNGNVTTEERSLDGDFDEIKVSRGLDVYLTQSNTESISVQADENLHDIIITEIEDNVLKIYADKNIKNSKSQKIMVSFDNISKITATSGSDVFSTNTITVDKLTLKTTSGADMELDVNAETIDCKSTSGSDLKLSGITNNLYAEATSGSDIKATDLKANICNAKATSGADIKVTTKDRLHATATSGGNIKYSGNPKQVEKTDGVSGSIRKQ